MLLVGKDRRPFATGGARYRDSDSAIPGYGARMYIQVRPEPLPFAVLAMVDTAAPWCIFRPEIARILGDHLEAMPGEAKLSTRLGEFRGTLYRGLLTVLAQEGDSLEVEATIFVSADWPGGDFVGYEGFLQRFRFAVDPHVSMFYFGQVE